MYRPGTKVGRQFTNMNFVLNHGALGDVMASLPAILHARQRVPNLEMTVWAPAYLHELLAHLLAPYGAFKFERFEDFKTKAIDRDPLKEGPYVLNSVAYNTMTRNRQDMVNFAFHSMLDTAPETHEMRSYPTQAPLGPRPLSMPYVVVPVGSTSDNKALHHSVMTPVLEWLLSVNVQPVITGTNKSYVTKITDEHGLAPLVVRDSFAEVPEKVRNMCLDMRNQMSLVELRTWCGHAEAVIGVDGGTLHLACTTDAPIVYGLTTVRPIHRTIARHGKPGWKQTFVTPRNLACAGCQSNWMLVFGHDFSTCAYGDNACVTALHSDDYIDALRNIGVGEPK